MPDVITEIKKKMDDILSKRDSDLNECKVQIENAQAFIEEAKSLMQDATATMNLKQYETAKKKKENAKTLKEMYSSRLNQIQKQKMISETESDANIDMILSYEKEISDEYNEKVRDIVEKLNELTKEYKRRVSNAETLIHDWTSLIHANYRKAGVIYRSSGTNRSDIPIDVRNVPYNGSTVSNITEIYIDEVNSTPNDKPFYLG